MCLFKTLTVNKIYLKHSRIIIIHFYFQINHIPKFSHINFICPTDEQNEIDSLASVALIVKTLSSSRGTEAVFSSSFWQLCRDYESDLYAFLQNQGHCFRSNELFVINWEFIIASQKNIKVCSLLLLHQSKYLELCYQEALHEMPREMSSWLLELKKLTTQPGRNNSIRNKWQFQYTRCQVYMIVK